MSSRDRAQLPGAGGGLWNCPRVPQYSQETQELLRVMMQESRLTRFQERQIGERLQKGGALPPRCHPTSSEVPRAPAAAPRPQPRAGPSPAFKPQRRSAEQCQAGDSYQRERFRPRPTRDPEKEKRRLQSLLATGREEPGPPPPLPDAAGTEATPGRDRFQEVLDEIEERRQFLEEMTALGRGKEYQTIISTEISQKIRELELIDGARCSELSALRQRGQEQP
uniref:Si:dkey-43k4.3 n=1 Tax=Lepisosteus oculatus TaxID=7918 RepID=W5N1M3_LEPOC|nr:PREDICTED: UPF0193 protein EVG1 [Lepisosteus oculatus]XP_015215166.1 PREDICTED: UPF0193 protein EVG1 [Lepisosteus oculatus]